jgi:hypothetical protein
MSAAPKQESDSLDLRRQPTSHESVRFGSSVTNSDAWKTDMQYGPPVRDRLIDAERWNGLDSLDFINALANSRRQLVTHWEKHGKLPDDEISLQRHQAVLDLWKRHDLHLVALNKRTFMLHHAAEAKAYKEETKTTEWRRIKTPRPLEKCDLVEFVQWLTYDHRFRAHHCPPPNLRLMSMLPPHEAMLQQMRPIAYDILENHWRVHDLEIASIDPVLFQLLYANEMAMWQKDKARTMRTHALNDTYKYQVAL